MRFQVGDRVEVVNRSLKSFGATGKIIEIDSTYIYPYEVEFDDGKDYGENLFAETDLTWADEDSQVVEEIVKEPKDYIDIKFQEGTVKRHGVNGAKVEDVIDVLVEKLQDFQWGKHPSREYALAITKLEEARMWLNEYIRKNEAKQKEDNDE